MKAYFEGRSLAYHLHALPDHGIVYVKNPKAACSTVLLWLDHLHTGELDFDPANVHTEHRLPKVAELGRRTVEELLAGAGYRFTFVRHPLTRFASAYRDKLVNDAERRPMIQAALGLPEDPDVPVSLEQFVSGVEQQDPLVEMDPHWRPQHVNLMHPVVTYDHVGRVETFSEDLATITKAAGLPPVPFVHRNASATTRTSPFAGRPDLVQRVEAIYALDYELYGYERTAPGDSPPPSRHQA
jgi:hypothetical protein